MATEIDRLEVVLTANFAKMEAQLKTAIAKNQQAKKAIEESWAGKGLTGAAEKGFENLTERIGEAARSIPVFGAALGALGPVGVAAAVAVGGFALAMEQTEKAVEYAAGIEKLSETIGVSTDFIQKFNFAARQSEVDVGAADMALKELNASLGAVQGNLPRAKQLAVVFKDALHMTPEDLRGYKDVGDLLPVIADKIRAAGSYAEQAAIAKKLGIEDLLPLLRQGADGFNRLAQEAQDLGVVMDHSLIEKGAETAKKLKELDDIMQAQKNQTFVQYADTIVKIKTAWNDALSAFLRYMAFVTGTTPLDDRIAKLQRLQTEDALSAVREGTDPAKDRELASVTSELNALRLQRTIQQGLAEKGKAEPPPPAVSIVPPKAKGAGRRDQTGELDKATTDALLSSAKDLTEAQLALADNLAVRAGLEKKAIDQDLSKKIADLEAERVKIEGETNDTNKVAQQTRITAAETNLRLAAEAKRQLVDQRLLSSLLDKQIANFQADEEFRAADLTAQADHLTAMAGLTHTAAQRAEFERAALAMAQESERIRDDSNVKVADANLAFARATKQDTDALEKASAAAHQTRDIHLQAQADTTAALNQNLQGPVQAYMNSIQDLSTLMANAGVDAAKSLSAGLADAIVNAKSLGDVATSVFKQMATQLAQALIEKNITSPLLKALSLAGGGGDIATMGSALTGLAGGTFSAAAGVALVGESGPELVRLPGGAQVITNNALRNLGMGGHGGGGTTITFDNRGAVIWEQAARQMMSYADRAAASAGMGAIGAARQITPNDLARSAGRRLS